MLTLLLSLTLGSTIPTAADVLLDAPSPVELTRLLLAQAPSQSDEEKNLQDDMDRARQRLGDKPTDKAETQPSGVDSPAGDQAPPEDQPRPKHRGRHRRVESGDRFRAMSEDGHGKAYYLVWGIVDWNIAGGLLVMATVCTVIGLVMLAVPDAATCNDRFGPGTCKSDDMAAFRNSALVVTGLGVGFGAGGGVVAWRASTNIHTYHDLRNEEREHYESGR